MYLLFYAFLLQNQPCALDVKKKNMHNMAHTTVLHLHVLIMVVWIIPRVIPTNWNGILTLYITIVHLLFTL